MNSRDQILEREREILRILNILLEEKLKFIVVGGYAIATYKKRFSIDLDIVVKEEDLLKIEELLSKEEYKLSYDKKISLLYGEKFKRLIKQIKGLDVNIDLMINGLVSRTTDCTWSFDYIEKNSRLRKLDSLEFLTPEKELLIAMKLHSGRLSDIRDIVALMPCDVSKLEAHLLKGDLKKLKESITKQKEFLEKPQFDDSFKGIFGIIHYNIKNIEQTKDLIKNILNKI